MMIVLNLVHILAGVFWAGSALLLTFFIVPAVDKAGREGGVVMQKLVKETRFAMAMMLGGVLTILSGLTMYWLASDRLSAAWLSSAHGIAITVGGVAGILAAILGGAVSGRATKRLGTVMHEIHGSGKPATAEQQAEIKALQTTMRLGSLAGTFFILIALIGMAVARTL